MRRNFDEITDENKNSYEQRMCPAFEVLEPDYFSLTGKISESKLRRTLEIEVLPCKNDTNCAKEE